MSTQFYWLVIGILAVWRITHLFYGEDGPWNVFVRLRRSVGEGFWGSLLDCFYCLSLWVALPLAYWLGESWKQRTILWLALSGGAIMLERLTANHQPKPEIRYKEYEEHDYVLRQEQNAIEDSDSGPAAQ